MPLLLTQKAATIAAEPLFCGQQDNWIESGVGGEEGNASSRMYSHYGEM